MSLPQVFLADRREYVLKVSPIISIIKKFAYIANFPNFAQYQILSQWCWSAVGAAVVDFYLGSGGGNRRVQCKNASEFLAGASNCCTLKILWFTINLANIDARMNKSGAQPMHFNINQNNCNQPGFCAQPINATGSTSATWDGYSGNGPNASEKQALCDALDDQKPGIMHISWNGGGGHVVSIYGLINILGVDYYYLADPWSGFRLSTGAPSNGTWAGSYLTSN